MNKSSNFHWSLVVFFVLAYALTVFAQNPDVGKWKRYIVSITNTTYNGNPFELEIDGTFTHIPSGMVIQLPGYYDGNDTWKIAFMPTLVGEWSYVTSSSDPDLNGVQGTINCVASGLPGTLNANPGQPRKWKFADGQYAIPIALRMEFFSEPATISEFTACADFLEANDIYLLETRLLEEAGQWGGRHDYIFDGDWHNHQFDLTIWDRMEQRMDILTDRGLGGHIMFYSDDAGMPSWSGQSSTEALVVRYVIARLASYPVVIFNTGIDISEYRSQSDIDWFGSQIRNLDPYDHPVSSRYGGGSGNSVMSGQTFESHGDRIALIGDITGYFQNASVPVSMDDAWGENRPSHPSKNFRPEDIRRAFWKCLIAGGSGGLIRGSQGYFYISNVESDLESEQWLKLINPFVDSKLGDLFGTMVPVSTLVSNGYCLADPARTKILYFLMGNNDKWDSGNGGNITVKLSGITGNFVASWFDPRSGQETAVSGSPFSGGSDYVISPPSADDWVMLVTTQNPDNTPPSIPTGFNGNPAGESQIDLIWNASNDPESGISHYNIYRDGSQISQASGTSFSDTGLNENTTYTYEVSAVNGVGLESGLSVSIDVTTLADNTSPTIMSAGIGGTLSEVIVVYSEPVEENSATDVGNYSIDNGITISSANLGTDLKTVTIGTSLHQQGVTYTLTVNNVLDLASNPNAIAPNTQNIYSVSQQISVSNLTIASGKSYEIVNSISNGDLVYIDRNFNYSNVPAFLATSEVSYIKTANDDKMSQGDNFLSFDVNQPVVVYVAHDNRYQVKPDWLLNFTNTSETVIIDGEHHTLFKRSFPTGGVILGGNINPSEPEGNNMYTVIITSQGSSTTPPSSPHNLRVRR